MKKYEIQIKRPGKPWAQFSRYKTLSNAEKYLALFQRQEASLQQQNCFRLIDTSFMPVPPR